MKRPFSAYIGDDPYIFVSYSHKNTSAAFPELAWLKSLGFNVWYDEGIEAGSEWREEIGKAVKNASLFVFLVSPESAQSENCRKEVSLADKEHIPIIAIHLKKTELPDGLDLTLSDRQAILKYEVSKQEYQEKIQSRISSYLDQQFIPPTIEERRKTLPILASAVAVVALAIGLFVTRSVWLPLSGDFPVPPDRWDQLTNFPDSVSQPALSPDGRILTFIHGDGSFVTPGQIYSKLLPDGTPVPLTEDGLHKMSPVFSPDGSRIAYTVVVGGDWDTWRVEALGGHPGFWLPNASGLVWTDEENLLFSEIIPGEGLHMKIVAAHETRAGARDVYVPEHINGMAHRAIASPNGAWAIIVEMLAGPFVPCRLVPLRGTAPSRQVGPPEGSCTFAAWSPDGEWMYFTSNSGGANHIWRQGFPDGDLQQITAGATEQEGIAVSPDGDFLITAVTLKKSSVWISDRGNVRAISREGYAFDPEFTPDDRYLLFRILEGTAPVSDASDLWIADLQSGRTELFLPGLSLFGFNAYDISASGSEVVVAAPDLEGRSRLWLAPLDRSTPPRQVPNVEGGQPFFGADGEIIFSAADASADGRMDFVFRVNPDGTGFRRAIQPPVAILEGLSPDGAWLIAQTTRARGFFTQAFPLEGGEPINLYSGAGTTHKVDWTSDGRFLLLPDATGAPWLEAGGGGHTNLIPVPAGQVFPDIPPEGYTSGEAVSAIPGVRTIDSGDVAPGGTAPDIYAYSLQTVQRNLYRIPLP